MKKILFITLLCVSTIAFAQKSKKAERPNVLLLMTDEHSPQVLGSYGDEIITPNLDALAGDGIKFTSAYCQNPVCVPSRVSLLTGRMASHLKVFGNSNILAASTYTMADAFSQAGYNTEWVGKEHWLTPGYELGFGRLNEERNIEAKTRSKEEDVFQNEVGRSPQNATISTFDKKNSGDYVTAEYAVKFLKQQKKSKNPFFLGVSFVRPHFPYEVQQEFYDLYKGKLKNPEVTKAMIANLSTTSQKEREQYKLDNMTEEQIQKAREIYYGMVTYVDEMIGLVLDELDKQGLRENTIILYTSDHGDLIGEHGLWYKNSFYEGSVGVPFIWSYPKALPTNKTITTPVMNMDIFPTLAEMCNISIPQNLGGSSMVSLMKGKDKGKNRVAISENYRRGAGAFMVRKGNWKYCWYEDSKAQLFNLNKDPKELINLIANPEYANVVKELNAIAMENYIKKSETSQKKKTKKKKTKKKKTKKD